MVLLRHVSQELADAQTRELEVVDEEGERLAAWRCVESINPSKPPDTVVLHLESVERNKREFEYHVSLDDDRPPESFRMASGRRFLYASWMDEVIRHVVDEDYRERLREHAELMYAESKARGRQTTNGTFERVGDEPGRNDPCPCGSGRKYKKCHLRAVDRGEVTITELRAGRNDYDVDPGVRVEVEGRLFRILRDQDDDHELDDLLESLRRAGVERTEEQVAEEVREYGAEVVFESWNDEFGEDDTSLTWMLCALSFPLMKHLAPDRYELAELGTELDRILRLDSPHDVLTRGAEILASVADIVASMDPEERTLEQVEARVLPARQFGNMVLGLYEAALVHAKAGDERIGPFLDELERLYDLLEGMSESRRRDWLDQRIRARDELLGDREAALDMAREAVEAFPDDVNLALTYSGVVLGVDPTETDLVEAERALSALERSIEGREGEVRADAVARHLGRMRDLVEDIREFRG
jgi:tetratricopeptide (TPR) repeat protein